MFGKTARRKNTTGNAVEQMFYRHTKIKYIFYCLKIHMASKSKHTFEPVLDLMFTNN